MVTAQNAARASVSSPRNAGVTPIAFMTANEVARESGWAIHDWAEGDRATNEAFAPIETYGERFDALLGRARALGFGTIDLWGAHLEPGLGDRRARALAREALGRHGITVATYATWVGPAASAAPASSRAPSARA